jgi:hypothetical protein
LPPRKTSDVPASRAAKLLARVALDQYSSWLAEMASLCPVKFCVSASTVEM